MKRLLLFDYLRGPDATGLAVVSEKGEAQILKLASHPLDFFELKPLEKILRYSGNTVFLGHNRLATTGAKSSFNAHPYQFGHIIGAHNGTISDTCWAELEKRLGTSYGVDSMAVFAHIEKFGIEETVPLLQGAWALVWVDTIKDTINFIHNSERPLWYAFEKGMKKIIWASEYHMIYSAVGMSAISYDIDTDSKNHHWFSFPEDRLCSIDLTELCEFGLKNRSDMVKQVLKGKEPAPVNTGQHPFHYHGQNGKGTVTSMTPSTNDRAIGGQTGFKRREVINAENVNDPFDGLIDFTEFERAAKVGCLVCGNKDMHYGETGLVYYQQDELEGLVCSDCGDSGSLQRNRIYMKKIPEDYAQSDTVFH